MVALVMPPAKYGRTPSGQTNMSLARIICTDSGQSFEGSWPRGESTCKLAVHNSELIYVVTTILGKGQAGHLL